MTVWTPGWGVGTAAAGDLYQATYDASANVYSTDEVYSVSATATDMAGNASAPVTTTFTVASAGYPPPPPIS